MKTIDRKIRNPRALRMQALADTGDDKTSTGKYGITEKKKAEIDALSTDVLDNQGQVDQLQAIVLSLTEKSNKLQVQLNDAKTAKATALSNNELGQEVLTNAQDLMDSSEQTYKSVVKSEKIILKLSKSINDVTNKLIYSVEVINKLAALVTKKKASNPLISDELVSAVVTAGTDANNAVALTMTALQSVFTAQASVSESESSLALEYLQSVKLVEFITGEEADFQKSELPLLGITTLLQESYDLSVFIYDRILEAYQDTQGQLENAKIDLSQAQTRLASSQAGLAAANAAALAS